MKLRKIGGIYHAAFRTADGTTKTVTTRSRDKREAARIAAESGVAEMEMAARSGRLTREALGKILTGRKLTLESALQQYEAGMKASARSPKTIANNLGTLHAWMREMKLEKMPPAGIAAHHIADWINAEGETKLGTRIVKLASLRTFFTFMAHNGWLASDVSARVSVDRAGLSHEQKESAVRTPFTDAELKRLHHHINTALDDAERDLSRMDIKYHGNPGALRIMDRIQWMRFWRFAVKLSAETGLRLGDIACLEWSCFERAGKIIVHTGKRNKRVELKISDELVDLTTTIPVTDPKRLFPQQCAIQKDVNRRSLLSVYFGRLCEAARIRGKSFHCLRHTLASKKFSEADKESLARKLAESLTVGQIAQLLGHSDSRTTKGYVH